MAQLPPNGVWLVQLLDDTEVSVFGITDSYTFSSSDELLAAIKWLSSCGHQHNIAIELLPPTIHCSARAIECLDSTPISYNY
jgi:hypothetical protein